jgi:NCS1 family nucleobase:cation symporter-1
LIPDLFFARFGAFLGFIGVAMAPLCGIQIADYYVLRRRKIDVRAIYDRSSTGAYVYWAGFNPVAIVALGVGCAVYMYLLNPISYESHAPYRFLTASLPAAFVSACVYIALTLLFVVPAGRGGYPRS